MNLTRRQITLLVASMLAFQEQFTPDGEFYQELDGLIELLDKEHQKTMKMVKVVYNACYGGFGLSNEAKDRMVELGYEMEVNPNYDPKPGVEWYNRTQKYKIYDGDIDRHNPILVQVVEELGDKANGDCAKLLIEEVSGPYRIDEYDGFESVETPGGYDWIIP